MKNKYVIHNQTSEDMSAVPSESVDIVVFAPPYNIDTPYDVDNKDRKPFEDFKNFLTCVIKESSRVLKPNGIFFSESADTVYSDGKLIELSGLIQKICIESDLCINKRHINFLQSEDGVVLLDKEHNWSKDYYSEEESHSTCHQWLLFRKGETEFDFEAGKVFYVNYPHDEEDHPCPFSPEHVRIFLRMTGFDPSKTLLEPFMGTSRMGEEVLKRGGNYIGYELAKKHFDFAKRRLEEVK